MRTVIYVPLERLDGRYTSHLDRDITAYLNDSRIQHLYLLAPYTEPPPSGMFLNAAETIMNKNMQMGAIAQCYKDGFVNNNTIFFFSDLWFPGIESLAYLNHFYKVRPEIRGIIHAGSWTDTDEVRQMERWASMFENVVFDIADKIFVGSDFIKKDIIQKRLCAPHKLVATGLPLDTKLDMYRAKPYNERSNIIVFNGRNHPEKQPHLWVELQDALYGHDYEFIWTQEKQLSKTQYYELLCEAKVVVSFALQENFGYGIAEAVKLGCIPVVPDRLCYREQYADEFRYKEFSDCVSKVNHFMMSQNEHAACTPNTFVNPIPIFFR